MRGSPARTLFPLLALAGMACAARGDDAEAARVDEAPPTLASVGSGAGLVIDSAARARMGVVLLPLSRSMVTPEMELTGVVVPDPGAVTIVRAGVSGRLATIEPQPWPRVGDRLEAGVLVAQVGDARPVPIPRAGTVARLLAQPGELVQAGQELLELVDYTTALVRVAWTGSVSAPRQLALRAAAGGPRVTGRLEGPAPEADPLTQAPAILYRVANPGGLRPGVAVAGFLPDPAAPRGGVLLPARAVVQWDALAWAYVERAGDRFVRVRVPTEHPVSGGWLVVGAFVPGDRVVVEGAAQLLSEEFRTRITVGEEVGE